MYISYKRGKEGAEYATVMSSKKKDGRVVKESVIYLGKVVDREKGVYHNRERGTFTYDIGTGEYGMPSFEQIQTNREPLQPKCTLDFGDVYALSRLMDECGLSGCIDAMGTGGEDTTKALVLFCTLTDRLGMCNAEDWFDGSYARILYAKAVLASQRISDALAILGDERSYRDFMGSYIPLVTGNQGQCVAVDSKGVVNSIDIGLTQVSNHNGDVNIELRLIMVVQLVTGMPICYRVVPGNIIDAITLTGLLDQASEMGVNIAFSVIDAGYCTITNMNDLFKRRVNFVTRLKPNMKLYGDMVREHHDGLESTENRTVYNGRIAYVKRVPCMLTDTYSGYAYIIEDTDRKHQDEKNAAQKFEKGEITDSELSEIVESAGIFVLISSYMIPPEEVLGIYYTRQCSEQFFDLMNGYANLTPLRAHEEETVRGMVMITFISSALIRTAQIRLKGTGVTFKTAMLSLRNQKSRIYDGTIYIDEPMRKANVAYRSFNIESPSKLPSPDV